MKTLTVRLPEGLAAEIETESRERGVSKSDVVRERLEGASRSQPISPLADIADLIGSLHGLPPDLSARRNEHRRATGHGRERPR